MPISSASWMKCRPIISVRRASYVVPCIKYTIFIYIHRVGKTAVALDYARADSPGMYSLSLVPSHVGEYKSKSAQRPRLTAPPVKGRGLLACQIANLAPSL